MSLFGISTKTASNTTHTANWNGGEGMFSVVADTSWVGAVEIKLQHDVSADGETDPMGNPHWEDVGPAATLTANGSTLFTTSSPLVRVLMANSGGVEVYHVNVKPTYTNKAL